MKLTGVELRRIAMPLVSPFRTSFGDADRARRPARARRHRRRRGLGRVRGAWPSPLYSPEYVDGADARAATHPRSRACSPADEVDRRRRRARPAAGSRATGWPRPRWRRRCSTPSCAPTGARSPATSARCATGSPSGVSVGHHGLDPGAARRRRRLPRRGLPCASS